MASIVQFKVPRKKGETDEEYQMRQRRINLSRATNYMSLDNSIGSGGLHKRKPIHNHDCSIDLDCSTLLDC